MTLQPSFHGPIYGAKELPDGREVVVLPLTYDRARIVITSPLCRYSYEDAW